MSRLPEQARARYHQEMTAAKTATTDTARWTHLERAHLLSQPDPCLHTGNHLAMFSLAVRRRDRREHSAKSCGSWPPHRHHWPAAMQRAIPAAPAPDCPNRCRHHRIWPPCWTRPQSDSPCRLIRGPGIADVRT